MTQQELPYALNNILESYQAPDTLFSELLAAVGNFYNLIDVFYAYIIHRITLLELPFVGFALQIYLPSTMKTGQRCPHL